MDRLKVYILLQISTALIHQLLYRLGQGNSVTQHQGQEKELETAYMQEWLMVMKYLDVKMKYVAITTVMELEHLL